MLTADTITVYQLRELRRDGLIDQNTFQFAWLAKAYPVEGREALARCAEILNARAKESR